LKEKRAEEKIKVALQELGLKGCKRGGREKIYVKKYHR